MIISNGTTFSENGWAGIRYQLSPETPDREGLDLFISLPDEYADWISDRMEAPVLAALFPAMALGESIRIERPMSERLYYNLHQVMEYFHLWFPDQLSIIDIMCNGFDQLTPKHRHTLGCFSGGLDSFYTLMKHRKESQKAPSYRMTHALFIHGFDMALSDTDNYNALADRYERVVNEQGIQLVRMRTNVRDYVCKHVRWLTTHGAVLGMAAHFLANGIGKFIIPSSNRFSMINPPIGSNPLLDPLTESESLEVIHDGCEASRIDKVMAISDWPPAQQNLRVCWQNMEGRMNCCRCNKCQKVMMPLWISGKLHTFECFDDDLDPSTVSPTCFDGFDLSKYAPEKSYGEELEALAQHYDPHMLRALPLPQPEGSEGLLAKLAGIMKRRA